MSTNPRQINLFEGGWSPAPANPDAATDPNRSPVRPRPLPLQRPQLLDWQRRLAAHQGPLFAAVAAPTPGEGVSPDRAGPCTPAQQGHLFSMGASPSGERACPDLGAAGNDDPAQVAARFDPLSLRAQSLSFWRWPEAPHQGAALYLVLDRPDGLPTPLLLYVGETARADRRWKGDHDCKHYLAAYSEALRQVDLMPRLSIRFWCDVPAGTRARRALEQALIRHWWPPFNKETRERWVTPFTADLA